MTMLVREVNFADLPAVAQLFQAAGWVAPCREEWSRLWVDNPALKIDRPQPSRGWVLESDQRLVGFMGNLTQLYSWEGRILRSATAFYFYVLPEFRGMSLRLVLPFVGQSHVDLLLNTTASVEASRVFQFLKFARLPVESYNVSYYWVTEPMGFVRAALRKKGLPAPLARIASAVMSPAAWAALQLGRRLRGPGDQALRIDVATAEEIGPEFDEFWDSVVTESPRLLALRTSEILRHRFCRQRPPVRVIRAWRDSRLVGYAVMVRADTPRIGLTRFRIADLVAKDDEPSIVRALHAATQQTARREKVHMLEVNGFPTHIRSLLQRARPFRLVNDSWPYLYKTHDPTLRAALESPDRWYPTLLDGDGC